jgi:hypothetical protein
MAEEVKIVDVAGGPAAEATLQEILKLMRQRGGGGSGGGSGGAAKAQELYTTAVTRGTTVQKKNTGEVKNTTSALKTFSSGLSTVIGGAFGALGTVLGATTGLVTNFGSAVANASTIGEFLDAVPVFGSLLSKASGYFDASLSTFQQLSTVGAGFGNDMMAMRGAAAQAGLNLDMFAEMVSGNAENMRLLGGSTSEGAKRFGQITKQLRSADAGLTRLGFTQQEVNEGFGDYLEMMALSGNLQGRSNQQLAAGAQNYLTEIDKLSRVTGRSRKALQEEMNSRNAAANINVLAARLSGDALNNFNNNMSFTSSIMGEDFTNAMADMADGVSQSRFAQVLEANVPGLAELQRQNASGSITQAEYQSRLMALMPRITEFADNMGAAGVSALMGGEGTDQFMNAVANARKSTQTLANNQQAAAEQARRAPLTESYATFAQKMDNIRTQIETALLDSGVLAALGEALEGVSGVGVEVARGLADNVVNFLKDGGLQRSIESFRTWISETRTRLIGWVSYLRSDEFKAKVDSFIASIKAAWTSVSEFVTEVQNVGITQAIANMLGAQDGETLGDMVKRKIGEGLSSLWENAGLVTKIGAGIAALFVGSKVIGALTGGIGRMFGGLFGGGGAAAAGGRGGPPGVSGAGKAGKGLGDFVGNVGGGVLSGIAKGLSAFGNPQVAIGGAVLAGVILVIGAAVAGATWLVGKSLPTFAEGMQAFETLDGAKLSAAGKGMLAVAGGMAAFGAGSAVAGLGNLVGNIADGISGLFGGEKANPLEQLLEFQKYNIDQAKVEGNANALVAYSKAMAAYGGADAASGLGSLVGGLADGITSFFGGETGIPYDDIIAFQQYTFDTEKVRANAAAMVAFNQALTSSSGAQATSGVGNAVGAIGNAIASFFGADTPFDQVKDFGKEDLDPNGNVVKNATAMTAMANALASFSGGDASEIDIPQKTVNSLQRLGEMGNSAGIATLATNLQSVADVQGLATNVNMLNSLDTESISNYNTAMERLVEVLGELNDELSKDNKVGFGTGTNAGDVVAKMDSIGGGSGTGSTEQLDRLNMLVAQLITLQHESNRNTRNTVTAINGNLQLGV